MIHIPGFTFPVQEYLLEDVIEKLRQVFFLNIISESILGGFTLVYVCSNINLA